MPYDAEHFDELYAEGGGDPWGFWDSEYERTKAERTVAGLRDRRDPGDLDRVLDAGCANGAKTERLVAAAPDAEVVGVDVSTEALAVARDRVPGASYVAADLGAFVAGVDRPFDAVVAVETLGYLAAEYSVTDLLTFAVDLRDALADDGLLVATHLTMPRGEGPVFGQERTTRVLREALASAFETVGRERYVERKETALDPDESPVQPYEVWAMRPRNDPVPSRGR